MGSLVLAASVAVAACGGQAATSPTAGSGGATDAAGIETGADTTLPDAAQPDSGQDADGSFTDTSAEIAVTDVTPPTKCTCAGGCAPGEACLHHSPGGLGPNGPVCGQASGLQECRVDCTKGTACPPSRPHCVTVSMAFGCCSDAIGTVRVCCANQGATSVTDCF
jgi:hypothetical protein